MLGGLLSAEKVRVVEPKGTLERENQPVFDVPIVRLATGGRDGTARLWDLTARDPAANPIVLRGPEGDFQSEGLDFPVRRTGRSSPTDWTYSSKIGPTTGKSKLPPARVSEPARSGQVHSLEHRRRPRNFCNWPKGISMPTPSRHPG